MKERLERSRVRKEIRGRERRATRPSVIDPPEMDQTKERKKQNTTKRNSMIYANILAH